MPSSNRTLLIARAAPSASVIPLSAHAAFIESDLSTRKMTQPGLRRDTSCSYTSCSFSARQPPDGGCGGRRALVEPPQTRTDHRQRPRRTGSPAPRMTAVLALERAAVPDLHGPDIERSTARALHDL